MPDPAAAPSGKGTLRLATRGSKLALRQTGLVAQALHAQGWRTEVVRVTTSGDRRQTQPLQDVSKDAFVGEVREALLQDAADLAVHSLKDLPLQAAPRFALAAIGERQDCADVLLTPGGGGLQSLLQDSRVGTSSLRRQALLRRHAPQAEASPIRGNIDTRIAAMLAGSCDGLLLAAAGLNRLGLDQVPRTRLEPAAWLPAPGQGAIAVEVLAGDARAAEVALAFDHGPSRAAVTAERTLAAQLGVDCNAPLGVWGSHEGGRLVLRAFVAAAHGDAWLESQAEGGADEPEQLGRELARRMVAEGALEVLGGAGGPGGADGGA